MTPKKCILCGKCRSVCPVYKAVMRETAAPRAKAVLAEKGRNDKLFYLCTMCGACRVACPIDADLQIAEHRAALVEEGDETGPNKKMIENLRKYGNPFGEGERNEMV